MSLTRNLLATGTMLVAGAVTLPADDSNVENTSIVQESKEITPEFCVEVIENTFDTTILKNENGEYPDSINRIANLFKDSEKEDVKKTFEAIRDGLSETEDKNFKNLAEYIKTEGKQDIALDVFEKIISGARYLAMNRPWNEFRNNNRVKGLSV